MSVATCLILVFAFALVILYFRRRHLFTDLRDELVAPWQEAKGDMAAQESAWDRH